MPMLNTQEYEGYNDLLESMDTAIAAVRSFGSMLEFSLRTGEDMSNECYGVQQLLVLQCAHLDSISTALRAEISEIRAAKLVSRNSEDIAAFAGVSHHLVNRIMAYALGVDLGPPTPDHTDTAPYTLKKEADNARS